MACAERHRATWREGRRHAPLLAVRGAPLPAAGGAPGGAPLHAVGGAPLPAAGGAPLLATGGAQAEEKPLIIKLCLGEELALMGSRRENIFINMRCDPGIDIVAALGVVLGAEMEVSLRFRRYKEFPFALCKLCRRWFKNDYVLAINAFLDTAAEKLDRGMSQPLQQLAKRDRTSAESVTWMQSKPVQDFLEAFVLRCEATSLPVERKFAQIKKWETSRLVDVQTASENSILQAFSRERELASKELNAALKEQRRVKYLNARALAVVANPKCNPNLYQKATASAGLLEAAPLLARGGALPAAPVETPKKRSRLRGPPGSAESTASTPSHASPAKASPTRESLVEQAGRQVQQAFDRIDGLLLTRAQVKAWMVEQLDVFRERMREVRKGDRKQFSVRVHARAGLPSDKERGRLEVKEVNWPTPSTFWVLILWRRSGWFGARAADGSQALFFLYTWRQRT